MNPTTNNENKSINDLFKKLGALDDLLDEVFQQRIDKAVSKENIRETMAFVFPRGLRQNAH
jgi:hypothetical protein